MKYLFIFLILALVLSGCVEETNSFDNNNSDLIEVVEEPKVDLITEDRESKIPEDAIKVMPEDDLFPPVLHSDEFYEPVPMEYPINTKGAEDSAFIMPNGVTFYFFFTPDVRVPIEKQVIDGVTGVYVSHKIGKNWTKPERVILQDRDKLALDGCEFILGNKIWVCSAREGYTGLHWFTAEFKDGKYQDWQLAEKKYEEYEIGELHITSDMKEIYFHSAREGSKGSYDIWVSDIIDGIIQPPKNIEIVNTNGVEGWPFINENKTELWFTRTYLGSPAIFRSKKVNEEWQEPELIVSQFAGEPTLDKHGNLYFTHHFYKDGNMIEADIYVAYKK
jgi:hypothetical protein